MIVVSNCEADFNLLGEWKCRGDESPVCPGRQAPMNVPCGSLFAQKGDAGSGDAAPERKRLDKEDYMI